jgi:prepilin-type N-terminal cleavage/methylation domain-containing protein
MTHPSKRGEAGFSFIEILVVMGIISVLVSMVVVLIPNLQERSRQTKSKDNVKSMITLMLGRATEKGWPRYSGKNFVLSLVATGQIDQRNSQNLEILFSPGDTLYSLEAADRDRYADVNKKKLKAGDDFHELTSYAGRRNGDREYLITPDQLKMGTMVMCDDDDGPLHHPDGIVAGYTNGAVKFLEWEDLDMVKPEDPDNPDEFLGDASGHEILQKLQGR